MNPDAGRDMASVLSSMNTSFSPNSSAVAAQSSVAIAPLESYYQELQPNASLVPASGSNYSASDRVPLPQNTASSVSVPSLPTVGNVVQPHYQHFTGANASVQHPNSGLIMLPNTNPQQQQRGLAAASNQTVGGNVHASMLQRQTFQSYIPIDNKPTTSVQMQPNRVQYSGYSIQQIGQQQIQLQQQQQQQQQAGGQMLQLPMPIQVQIGPGGLQGQLIMQPSNVRVMNPSGTGLNPSQPKQPVSGWASKILFCVLRTTL